jgi:WS/DGAT/MGAT family acyltransferase
MTGTTVVNFRNSSGSIVYRLSGLDTGFLSLEMPAQPMQCIALGVLRAGISGPLSFEELRHRLTARLDQLPALRSRVVPVPLGLAPPVVAEDPHFDLVDHLFHDMLPDPGGPEELNAACARLASQQINRDRPLWRITLIDGLAGGRQAILLEIHHALMDGVAIRTTLAQIFSEEQQPAICPLPWRPGRIPGRRQLVAAGLAHHARTLTRLPELITRTRRATVAVRLRQAGTPVKVPQPGVDAPLSVLNCGCTPERRVARAVLPLKTVLAVKDIAGVTVNDVVLALVGSTLRSYLQARGALPERPLVAFVPVGLEGPEGAGRATGNRIARLTTTLATDIADPWERLRRISAVTAEAKACLDLAGRGLMMDWLECVPPMLMGPLLRRAHKARRRPGTRQIKLDENVVVSNLRGPSAPWQFGSAVVEEMYLFGPPNCAVGVNIAFWDYADQLRFGILSLADVAEDPGELAVRLIRSLKELVAAAERAAAKRGLVLDAVPSQ